MEQFHNYSSSKIVCLKKSFQGLIGSCSFHAVFFKVNPFWVQLSYFVAISLVGYLSLRVSNPRTLPSYRPENLDIYFTAVSALTNSSMATVEMEVFSNFQLIVITILMVIGGEVFISWFGLHVSSKSSKFQSVVNRVDSGRNNNDLSYLNSTNNNFVVDQIELGHTQSSRPNASSENDDKESSGDDHLKHNSVRFLSYVVLAYLLVVHFVGTFLLYLYVSLIPSARDVLKNKGLQTLTFSVFTIVSTFTNNGFVPTNENMIVFKKNSGLLLLLIPQILLGNTLYPACLLLVIWIMSKITKRVEFEYMLKNSREFGYRHLFSGIHSSLLVVTAFVFICLQFVLFCSLEWRSEATEGLNLYQKIVAITFEVINSRHSGETVFDLSTISPAILVLFVVMMYLPPYTSFFPIINREKYSRNCKVKENEKKSFVECLLFSQLSYLAIAIILVCITEREKLREDPLNFNVLNITIEVISAYGNVGFTTGYSCKRQLKAESFCTDRWYGFVGRWSNQGKFILILVMFFGKLKTYNIKGGKAWKLQ